MRHRASRTRLPWWVHVIVLSLILGSTAASVATGNPLYGVVGCSAALFVGSILGTVRGRALVARIARNRLVWLLAAGVAFATLAATVATLAVTR